MTLRPSRRWLRFSLRTLLVLVTVVCAWLGREANIVRERKAARAEMEAAGAWLSAGDGDDGNTLPFWRCWMGDEAVTVLELQEAHVMEIGLARADEIARQF